MLTRQRFCTQILIVLLLWGVFSFREGIQAAEYPVKPIVFVVQGEGGSGADLMVRPVTQKLSTILGKPVMIVNKAGAGGSIALKELHDAKPDGYTIGSSMVTIFSNKLQGISPYDHRDFTVICFNHVTYPILFASLKTKRPFKSAEEVVSVAKSRPGEVSIATSGVGYIWWIATMAFQEKTGAKFNVIPQPGTTAFVTSQVTGGHADLGISSLSPTKAQIDAGNLRFLSMFGPKRVPDYPDVPTLKESLGFDIPICSGQLVLGPPKMPPEIVEKLARAWEAAASDLEYQKFVAQVNSVPMFLPPDKALKYLDEQREIFRSVMDKAGILKEK